MRFRFLCLALSVVALLAVAPPDARGAGCKIVDDMGNRYKIGLHAIGKPLLRVMSRDEAQKCGLVQDLVVKSDGHVDVPKGPGLGVEIDFDLIESSKTDVLR